MLSNYKARFTRQSSGDRGQRLSQFELIGVKRLKKLEIGNWNYKLKLMSHSKDTFEIKISPFF